MHKFDQHFEKKNDHNLKVLRKKAFEKPVFFPDCWYLDNSPKMLNFEGMKYVLEKVLILKFLCGNPLYMDFRDYMWHFIGKGPIWSVLEKEILQKIGEMVKKLKKIIFLILEG